MNVFYWLRSFHAGRLETMKRNPDKRKSQFVWALLILTYLASIVGDDIFWSFAIAEVVLVHENIQIYKKMPRAEFIEWYMVCVGCLYSCEIFHNAFKISFSKYFWVVWSLKLCICVQCMSDCWCDQRCFPVWSAVMRGCRRARIHWLFTIRNDAG